MTRKKYAFKSIDIDIDISNKGITCSKHIFSVK